MKKPISIVLLLCMLAALFSGMTFAVDDPAQQEEPLPVEETVSETAEPAAEAAEPAEEAETAEPAEEPAAPETEDPSLRDSLDAVWNKRLYVAPNKDAELTGKILVKLDLLKSVGTLYLPGKADVSKLCFSWDDPAVTLKKDDVVCRSGEAPVPAAGERAVYQICKGKAVALVTIKTVQGSPDVEPMFLELDESLGTIDAMNSDDEHETRCYGKVLFDGNDNYVSIKGRGNSTWKFSKKPYNITIHKDKTYDGKQKVKFIPGAKKSNKYCLLANYLDNSLLRNKVAMDLADGLGIGLGNEKLATDVVNGIGLGSRFVDVWMNGEYLGNYLMTPKKDLKVEDSGYMLDNDHIPEDVDQFKIEGMHDMPLKHNRINIEDLGDNLEKVGYGIDDIKPYIDEAFAALTDYSSENYQNYFDLESWAKMFLMVEVSKTYDCYAGNFLMRRDDAYDPSSKLIAGPAWDYDIAFGRTLHKFFVWQTEPMQLNAEGWFNDSIGVMAVDKPVSLLQELGKHASFMREVARVYNENLALFEDLPANVGRQREILRASALMNNDLWGTHSLSADYLIAPNTMSLLGTGEYALHYDVTLTWGNYVNNLKEFCTKRVLWLTDHLKTELPAGTVVQKELANGAVQLEAQLTSSGTKNSYQWQTLQDGVWVDIEGANGAKLKLTPEQQQADAAYRCVVNNQSTVVTQFHGGSVTVPVEAAVEQDPAAETIRMEETALREGTLTLLLGGEDVGDYTFAPYKDGWSIRNASGKYLNASAWGMEWSRTPLVWQLKDGVFTATTMAAKTGLFQLITLGYLIDVQLTVENGQIATTTGNGMTAGFLAPAAQ